LIAQQKYQVPARKLPYKSKKLL